MTSYITEDDVRYAFSRSSGPGGQNVNKVETKVRLYFDIIASKKLTPQQKDILTRDSEILRFLDGDSTIVITSQKFRSQARNREDALNMLNLIVAKALKPKIKRVKTKKPKSADRKRLLQKKISGERKKERRKGRDSFE